MKMETKKQKIAEYTNQGKRPDPIASKRSARPWIFLGSVRFSASKEPPTSHKRQTETTRRRTRPQRMTHPIPFPYRIPLPVNECR